MPSRPLKGGSHDPRRGAARALAALAAAVAATTWLACGGTDDAAPPPTEPDASTIAPVPEGDAAPPPPPDAADVTPPRPDAGDAARDTSGPVGCGTPVAKTGLLANQPVTVGTQRRAYAVNLPSTYDGRRSYPVIFVFHGVAQDAMIVRSAFQFERDHEADAIFVYPSSIALWDILQYDDASNQDVPFFDAMLADLEARYCVDSARVFATGVSRGGYFANHLGCHRAGVIAAVASHAAGGPLDPSGTHFSGQGNVVCPGAAVPALVVVGEADTVALSDAENTRRHYRERNGCNTATAPVAPSPCLSLQRCAPAVTYCRVPAVAHALWAQGSKATWDFFAAQ